VAYAVILTLMLSYDPSESHPVEVKSSFSIADAEKIADVEKGRIIIPREKN
jgi:hypothetical protein